MEQSRPRLGRFGSVNVTAPTLLPRTVRKSTEKSFKKANTSRKYHFQIYLVTFDRVDIWESRIRRLGLSLRRDRLHRRAHPHPQLLHPLDVGERKPRLGRQVRLPPAVCARDGSGAVAKEEDLAPKPVSSEAIERNVSDCV